MLEIISVAAVLTAFAQEPEVHILPIADQAQAESELLALRRAGTATGLYVNKDQREQDWMIEFHTARHEINWVRAFEVSDEWVAVQYYLAREAALREGRDPKTDPLVLQVVEYNSSAFDRVRTQRAKEVFKRLHQWLRRDESDDTDDEVKRAVSKVVTLWCQFSKCDELQNLEDGLKAIRGNNWRMGFKTVVRAYFAQRPFQLMLSDGFFIDPTETYCRNDNHMFFYHVGPTFRLMRTP